MKATGERTGRALLAVLVLPHELGHALLAWLCRLEPELTVLPSWEGPSTPLARFNARLDADTPTPFIRAVAMAPLPLALTLAGLLGSFLPQGSPLAVPLLFVLSFWGSLSGGDLAIAVQPRFAREQGEFLAPKPPRIDTAALLLTPLTVVALGVLLLQ